jgi:hypothetical protein
MVNLGFPGGESTHQTCQPRQALMHVHQCHLNLPFTSLKTSRFANNWWINMVVSENWGTSPIIYIYIAFVWRIVMINHWVFVGYLGYTNP